jgi:ATP-dependent Lon protease
MIASIINVSPDEKFKILETLDIKERLREITRIVNHQVEILELGNKIQSQVKNDMDKGQREFYLRQQLKAIKEELGEKEETNVEISDYRDKVEKQIFRKKQEKKPTANLQGFPACIPLRLNIRWPQPTWTG